MAATKLTTGIRSIGILALLLGGLAHAQTGITDPTADSQIRKNAPSMQKDGTDASTTAGAQVSKGDLKIMRDMAHANLAEIETGKLALEKSPSPEVKKFAQQMIDDHTQARTELQTLAQSKGVNLPAKPDKKHQAMAKKLQAAKADEFDRMYMKQVGINDHQKTLKLLQSAQKDANDPDLKALATKMTPIVEEHLQMSKQHVGADKGEKSGMKSASGKESPAAK